MNIRATIDKLMGKGERSRLLVKNIMASFVIKGWSALVVLLMVPLTLKCLGAYQNGVWLTVSSLLVWIDQMDIGLGNGLRNKLATFIAQDERQKAIQAISSTVAMLVCIMLPILIVLCALVWTTDVYSFLNVSAEAIPTLRASLLAAVLLVCLTFVFKFVGNFYMGMQLPFVSNAITVVGQTLALLATAALLHIGQASFFNVVLVNTAAPLLVYLLAYLFTFYVKYRELRPNIGSVNLKAAADLGNTSLKFFWIQVATLIQYMSANILISKLFSPEMVTPYQIAYRYMSLIIVVFTVVCMPFWNATTDAYARGDMDWIRRASRKTDLIIVVFGLSLVIMTIVSPMVYHIWIGSETTIPFGITAMMALYIFLLILSMRYSYFLSGVGALRIQLYMTVTALIFIPAAWLVSIHTDSIIWFMAVMCICVAPGAIANATQLNKILNGKATGIWKIDA